MNYILKKGRSIIEINITIKTLLKFICKTIRIKSQTPKLQQTPTKLTVRRRLTPLRPAAKCPSCALLAERENTETGDPSS